jgi:hypothetical protein
MSDYTRTVPVPPDSELARALEAATGAEDGFIADTGVARYRVSVRRADAPARGQVARALAGIRAAAGAWAEHDAAALKAALRARRRSGSRPSVRW